jgi:hypothetical protein
MLRLPVPVLAWVHSRTRRVEGLETPVRVTHKTVEHVLGTHEPVGDHFVQSRRRRWVRLHEKGGKEHDVPCHHNLDHFLDEYIAAAGIAADLDGNLFRAAARKTGLLTERPMHQQDAYIA